ncbi:hypothetical protein FOL46_006366, partial [Perkinsus olseni]
MSSSTDTNAIASLLEAAYNGDVERMKELLSHNSDLTVNSSDYDKRTPLHLAAAGGHLDAVKYLISEGAHLKPDRFGMLPVHDAVINNHPDIKDMLGKLELKTADDGMCYLPPEKVAALKEQVKHSDISLSAEELETKMTEVFSIIMKEGVLAAGSLWQEVQYYFMDLGLHPSYFKHFTSTQIARHIHCLLAATKVAQTTNSDYIHFEMEDDDSAFYLTTMEPEKVAIMDGKIAQYVSKFGTADGFSITFMKSEKPAMPEGKYQLGIFVVEKRAYAGDGHNKTEDMMDESDLKVVASPKFLEERSAEVQQYY